MVPHANELQREFADKGLQIIGVTGEDAENTEPWVEDKGVEYAYAYDREGLGQQLGIRGIPHGVLVDPYGTIVWRGHPASLSNEEVEKATENALAMPMWEWPESASALKEAIAAGKMKRAIEAAKALDVEGLENAAAILEKTVEQRVASLAAMVEDADVKAAMAAVETLTASLEGLPAAERVSKLAKELESEAMQAALAVQKQVDEWNGMLPRSSEDLESWTVERADELVAKVEAEIEALDENLREKAPGRQASEFLEMLQGLADYLREDG